MYELDMEEAKSLETKFSTADAEYPSLIKDGGLLTLKYEDWREVMVEVCFHETVAFKWQECESFLENERDDCCYEISNSKWLEEYLKQGVVAENENIRHFRFNFNGIGQLEVLSIGFAQNT